MPGLIEPTTRSPGHLILFYHDAVGGIAHTGSVRFVDGVDLDNLTLIHADAEAWASALKQAMGGNMVITDWGVKDKYGRLVYRAPLTAPLTGVITGTAAWRSFTLTLEGRGNAIGAGFANGIALSRWFSGNGYNPLPGATTMDVVGTAGLAALRTMFDASTRIFADFYGQKADVRLLAPVQMNAFAQRKHGF